MDDKFYVSERDIEELISQGNRSNANMAHNPETIHKYVADQVMKKFALANLPSDIKNAHINGDIHIHDLEFMMDRSLNCLVHDLRVFLRHGLKVDGNGDHTSVAGPPKRLSTVMNHTGEIMLSAQQDMSGGQGMTCWNVFAAPYVKDKEEAYDAVQQLIFNLNMAYASRGGQVPFTTIGLELGVPDFLLETPAILPGGVMDGSTYGDYFEEAKLLTEAFVGVLHEGDYLGKPHLFPNTTFSLRPEYDKPEYNNILFQIHNLSSKYGSPYFVNMFPSYQGVHTDYMGCRTRLSSDWTGDWEKDTLRTGNLAYVTINLPRIALESKDDHSFYEILRDKMELAQQFLLRRRLRGTKLLNEHKLFPFIGQKVENESYYNIDNSTLSIGFCGLAEAVKIITGAELGDSIANSIAMDILHVMRSVVNGYREDGLRWSLIQTPAESTAYRFAKLDQQKYPETAIYNGTAKSPYYTNSCHLPVDTEYSLTDKIKWESQTHPLTNGGHIFHAFMGESYSDPESLMSLTHKITKTDIGFWAYSSALSFCMTCHQMMQGLQNTCTHCGEKENVEWYDRITGYVQQVGHAKDSHGGWNDGKKQELIDRRRWRHDDI